MKSIKTRIQNLENSLSPKEPTLLEMMDMAMAKREAPYDSSYIKPKAATKEELEAIANEPGLLGLIGEGMLRVTKFKEDEEKGN